MTGRLIAIAKDQDVVMPKCTKGIVAAINPNTIFFQERDVKEGFIDHCCVNDPSRLLIFHIYNNGKIVTSGCEGCPYFKGKEN